MVDILLSSPGATSSSARSRWCLRFDLKVGASKMGILETSVNTLRLLMRHKLAR